MKGPWEDVYGYRRAIRSGDRVISAGTTAPGPTAADQTRAAFEVALNALDREGASIADVVRTRMYVTDRAHADAVGRVHGELFGAVKPVATLVIVAGLLQPEMLVEIEVEAVVS
jgi:enamine deaminase RidA (YjgF/YER057c/UK114 family)